jgi:hypothetical protein
MRLGNEVGFSMPTGSEIRTLGFNRDQNSYVAEPVQLLYDEKPKADPVNFDRRYRAFAWDESRKTSWCIDTSGNFFGMTRDRQLQVTAWHHHEMGGYNSTVTGGVVGSGVTSTLDPAYYICSGSVLSLIVIPNPVIGMNDLWLCVKRKINGSWMYHIERIIGGICPVNSAYNSNGVVASGFYHVDSAAYGVNDSPSAEDYSFDGDLAHIEGETPRGTIIGATGFFSAVGSVVSSGNTTIARFPPGFASAPFAMHMGLPFTHRVEPVRLDAGSQIGSAQGAIKRIHEIVIRLYRTLCTEIGRDSENIERLVFREGDTPLNKSPELFTGDKIVKINSDYDREALFVVEDDTPLPFSIIGYTAEGVTYD